MGVCVASNQAMNTARAGVRAAAEDDHHDMMLLISTASELFEWPIRPRRYHRATHREASTSCTRASLSYLFA